MRRKWEKFKSRHGVLFILISSRRQEGIMMKKIVEKKIRFESVTENYNAVGYV